MTHVVDFESLPPDDQERLLEVLSDQEFILSFRRGLEDFEAGRGTFYATGERPVSGERTESE